MGNLKDVENSSHYNGINNMSKPMQVHNNLAKLDQKFRSFWQHIGMETRWFDSVQESNEGKRAALSFLIIHLD